MALAFSIHNFISSVGADAGFAAIIGLAVLILLYFAHARETANLREEAAILAERLQQAEARVAELSRPQPVSTSVPAAEGVQVRDQRLAGVGELPFAPAGVAAPALAAATRVVPLPESPDSNHVAPEPAVAMAGAPVAAARTAAPSAVAGPPPTASPPASPPGAALPTGSPRPIPRPATAAGANGGSRGSGTSTALPREPASSPRPLPPLGSPARSRGGPGRRIAIGLIALVLLGAAAVALVVITSNNNSTSSSPPPRTTNAPAASRPVAAFSPAAVTVAVLNGTATNQLAHRVAAKLATSGYKEGKVATAANQTEATTIVAYLPGTKNRTDALHVATALNLKPAAVQPIDQGTQQVACPPPTACLANVVVTVGADLSTL